MITSGAGAMSVRTAVGCALARHRGLSRGGWVVADRRGPEARAAILTLTPCDLHTVSEPSRPSPLMLFGRARIESRVTRRHHRHSTPEELPVRATKRQVPSDRQRPAYFLGRPTSMYLDRYATARRNRPRT